MKGGQPILLAGQEAARHTQQFSAATLLLVFNRKPPCEGWATYPPGRPRGSSAYATVFGCNFTSGVYYKLYSFLSVVSSRFLDKRKGMEDGRDGRVEGVTFQIGTKKQNLHPPPRMGSVLHYEYFNNQSVICQVFCKLNIKSSIFF